MPPEIPTKLKGKERLAFARKCLTLPAGFTFKDIFGVEYQSGMHSRLNGTQNKHHGRQPGSYKHKRDIVRRSRRRNRAK